MSKVRAARKYGLYSRLRGAGKRSRWTQMSPITLPRESAVRYFQSALLANAMGELDSHLEYRLRPTK